MERQVTPIVMKSVLGLVVVGLGTLTFIWGAPTCRCYGALVLGPIIALIGFIIGVASLTRALEDAEHAGDRASQRLLPVSPFVSIGTVGYMFTGVLGNATYLRATVAFSVVLPVVAALPAAAALLYALLRAWRIPRLSALVGLPILLVIAVLLVVGPPWG